MERNGVRGKILIVEHSASTRLIARASIEGLGLGVIEATTGEEAIEKFDQEEADLVLLDVSLPGIDGFAVAERIRSHPKGTATPIIMVTAKDDVESIRRAFDAGATDFASRPVNWLILGQRLLFVLEAANRQREIEVQRKELEETQKLAHIGRWSYHVDRRQLDISNSSLEMIGLLPGEDPLRAILVRTPRVELERLQPVVARFFETGRPLELKHVLKDANGQKRMIFTHARRVERPGSAEIVVEGYSQDITDREKVERRARFLVHHDRLTGLKNQGFFREHLSRLIDQQRRDGSSNALLLLNLDNFSRINDLRGRDVGDQILATTADRISLAISEMKAIESDLSIRATIARVGGDEFAVLAESTSEPTEIARLAMRILVAIQEPIVVENQEAIVTGRIGIAISPQDGEDIGELIANADAANRHSRDTGGSGYQFYQSSMNEAARERLGLESDFRQALLRKEICVVYQPRVDMSTGIVIGAEALARWDHSTRGWISPQIFVQLAEESGLTFELGRAIIELVMGQMRRWRESGYDPIPISINVSPTLLIDDRLPGLLQEVMDLNGIPPSLVEIEITETVLIRREDAARVSLDKLKAMGLSIALDDFGTGYSALTHLQYFPVDVVKIDRSFVTALVDERGRAIVRGVISMAHAMGLRVVAEGVEDLQQRLFLAEEGCDEEQGYLFSKPVPAEEFEQLFWPAGFAATLEQIPRVGES